MLYTEINNELKTLKKGHVRVMDHMLGVFWPVFSLVSPNFGDLKLRS